MDPEQIAPTGSDLCGSRCFKTYQRRFFVGVIISISMYFMLLQNRNSFLGCEIFKDVFWVSLI